MDYPVLLALSVVFVLFLLNVTRRLSVIGKDVRPAAHNFGKCPIVLSQVAPWARMKKYSLTVTSKPGQHAVIHV